MTLDKIKERLLKVYEGAEVTVTDLTGTSDHIQVWIKSNAFNGKSRIQRHKMVMDIFDQELKSGEIHALTIQAETL